MHFSTTGEGSGVDMSTPKRTLHTTTGAFALMVQIMKAIIFGVTEWKHIKTISDKIGNVKQYRLPRDLDVII